MSAHFKPFRAALCTALCLTVLLGAFRLPAQAAQDECWEATDLPRLTTLGGLSAQSAVLIDADSGAILYGLSEQQRLPMASTTKIMTALCAVELGEVTELFTIPAEAVGIEGSSVYLYEGEQLTLYQLLLALLLESANDAAVAIAVGTTGSVEGFVAYMNQKAASLGLQNTNFENPHGLDGQEHYTTAYDLALIARAALAHPTLKSIMSTKKATVPLNGTQGVRLLLNHNKMLKSYDGAIGVKTGFTKRSGRCLVSAAERDGLTLIAVTLNAPDDWNDHTRMLDAGFATYERVTLCDAGGYQAMLRVTGGKEGYVLVNNEQAFAITLPRERGSMQCTVELERFLYAPVVGGTRVGSLVFRCDVDKDGRQELLSTLPLTCSYGVSRRAPQTLWQRILCLFGARN